MRKKIFSIMLVVLLVIGTANLVSASTCTYCGSGGFLMCQGDYLWGPIHCPWCDELTSHAASHHFYCTNGQCQASYYFDIHECDCSRYGCGYVCPY